MIKRNNKTPNNNKINPALPEVKPTRYYEIKPELRERAIARKAKCIFDDLKAFCAMSNFQTGEVIDVLVEQQCSREGRYENIF